MDDYLTNDLNVKVSDYMASIISEANKQLGHASVSQTVDNLLCAGVILDELLNKYPQVEAAYEDFQMKTLAARGE
jgi:galactitol-specific phosphotransferase system IIC component